MTKEQDLRCQQILINYEQLIKIAILSKSPFLPLYKKRANEFLKRYSELFNEELLYKK